MDSVSLHYTHDVKAVFRLLIDPDFLRRRCESAGEMNVSIDVKEVDGAFVVTVARDVESDLPAFAKKVFNPKNHVVDVTTWKLDGDRRVATYTVTVGKRIEIAGQITLAPTAGGCEYSESFAPTVRVALIGKRLEKFVARETLDSIRSDYEFTKSELTR